MFKAEELTLYYLWDLEGQHVAHGICSTEPMADRLHIIKLHFDTTISFLCVLSVLCLTYKLERR
jgi:hypothetical protein